ncbi:hypothetical protein CEXT_486071 [Caerostris extrusa]|uniref:Uncharacterized protein n=1 Tax=Caerostris extrusa TaxID=172846 RepID=A0AAV4MZZ3_CAEEX|nr:hypothetical protein CEXT_486071 [Caerostris extrusa]
MSSGTIENRRPFIDPKWLWDQHSEAEPSRDQCGMRLSHTSTIKVCATLQFYLNPFIGFGEIPLTCPNACHDHGNCHLGKCHCFPWIHWTMCADILNATAPPRNCSRLATPFKFPHKKSLRHIETRRFIPVLNVTAPPEIVPD